MVMVTPAFLAAARARSAGSRQGWKARLNVPVDGEHDAAADVLVCADCFLGCHVNLGPGRVGGADLDEGEIEGAVGRADLGEVF
jgi:DNA polymerase III epsilon subunit-like protein